MLTMTRTELAQLKAEAEVAPDCDRFADMKACDCPQCRLAKFENCGSLADPAPQFAEQSAVAALDKIRLAREAVAKCEAAEKKAKDAHKVAKRELDFARSDLEKLLNMEVTKNLFNQRSG